MSRAHRRAPGASPDDLHGDHRAVREGSLVDRAAGASPKDCFDAETLGRREELLVLEIVPLLEDVRATGRWTGTSDWRCE